jgi:uncharacterized protein (DUF2062 family)
LPLTILVFAQQRRARCPCCKINDDKDICVRRRALVGRGLALREAEIEGRMKELWLTPPRMIAFAMAAGVLIGLFGMGVGVLLHHM